MNVYLFAVGCADLASFEGTSRGLLRGLETHHFPTHSVFRADTMSANLLELSMDYHREGYDIEYLVLEYDDHGFFVNFTHLGSKVDDHEPYLFRGDQ